MRKILTSLAFLLVLSSLLYWANGVCRDKDARLEGVFREPADAVDAVVVGSSHSYYSWNPLVFYRRTGLRSVMFGSPSQPTWISYEYLKYALAKHRPRFVMFECYALAGKEENAHQEGDARRGIDAMPDLLRRFSCVERMYPEDDVESRYFPLAKYHSRWASLRKWDYRLPAQKFNAHGFLLSEKRIAEAFTFKRHERGTGTGISDNAKTWLERIKELVESYGARLSVYSAPYNLSSECYERVCQVGDWCAEHDVPFLNGNEWSFVRDFDPARDYADGGHVNFFGAEIVTAKAGDWMLKAMGESGGPRPSPRRDWEADLSAYERSHGIRSLYNVSILPMLRTWRVDCRMPSKNGNVGVSGASAERPPALQKEGFAGCKITGTGMKRTFTLNCNADGEALFYLRGMYARSLDGGNIPFATEFVSFKINGVEKLAAPVVVTHDRYRLIKFMVKGNRRVDCEVAVRAHRYRPEELQSLLYRYAEWIGEKKERIDKVLESTLIRGYLAEDRAAESGTAAD